MKYEFNKYEFHLDFPELDEWERVVDCESSRAGEYNDNLYTFISELAEMLRGGNIVTIYPGDDIVNDYVPLPTDGTHPPSRRFFEGDDELYPGEFRFR